MEKSGRGPSAPVHPPPPVIPSMVHSLHSKSLSTPNFDLDPKLEVGYRTACVLRRYYFISLLICFWSITINFLYIIGEKQKQWMEHIRSVLKKKKNQLPLSSPYTNHSKAAHTHIPTKVTFNVILWQLSNNGIRKSSYIMSTTLLSIIRSGCYCWVLTIGTLWWFCWHYQLIGWMSSIMYRLVNYRQYVEALFITNRNGVLQRVKENFNW